MAALNLNTSHVYQALGQAGFISPVRYRSPMMDMSAYLGAGGRFHSLVWHNVTRGIRHG